MTERTQPTTPFLALVLVVVAGAAYAVGASPIGDAFRAIWGTLALTIATWIGA
jgi:hypothetical protein